MIKYAGGIDIGASTAKAVILNENGYIIGNSILHSGINFQKTARKVFDLSLEQANITANQVKRIIACGYGKNNVQFAHSTYTEIITHATAAYHYFPQTLTVVDIGSQDNKIIKVNKNGRLASFKMNRKCSAGTGAFLEEIASRLNLKLNKIDSLARNANKEISLGSFCTVFTITEILSYIRKGIVMTDLAKGLLRSILKRVIEMDIFTDTVVLTGGVAAYNPYILTMLTEMLKKEVLTIPYPQLAGAEGAALLALKEIKIINE